MNRLTVILNFISHYKYLIVLVVGVAVVGFFDENSFMRRMKLDMQISDLEDEISRYKAENEKDTRQLRDLRRNPKAIEKIARERYFMKADDEDIFVLNEGPQSSEKSSNENTEQN